MAVFTTNIHPSFAETARRRGYRLNDDGVSDQQFAGLERQVTALERKIASVDPEAIAEAIRQALAPVAGKAAMVECDQSGARLNADDEFAGYDLNAMMDGAEPPARRVSNAGAGDDEFADYDLNALMEGE